MRLLQLAGRDGARSVARVIHDRHIHSHLHVSRIGLLGGVDSVYVLAQEALASGQSLSELALSRQVTETIDYDPVYAGTSEWRILPAIDHPLDPARCRVSGTGLTHLAGAKNRDAMHAAGENLTDSMRMYRWGVEGGRPTTGEIGVAPEWFFKGDGSVLRAHGEPLVVPPHAEDGGEEPEIAGIYMIDRDGAPRRIGMTIGNEFSDHRLEKRNYLYLAASKLRNCSIGPELTLDPDFGSVAGQVSIERSGAPVWSKLIRSGEAAMCHSLANLEHHHFKHEQHRRPGDIHVHFFGTDAFSFGAGVALEDGDVMQVRFEGFGRALRNPLAMDRSPQRHWAAAAL